MAKYFHLIIILLLSFFQLKAQQTTRFSNYLFSRNLYNPAAVSSKDCMVVTTGMRNQWAGFENAPRFTFIAATQKFGENKLRGTWHAAGLYIEKDKTGVIDSEKISPSYSYHFRLNRNYTIGAGITVGIRNQKLRTILLDSHDPALGGGGFNDPTIGKSNPKINFFAPDFTIGVSVNSKKQFFDFAVSQIGRNKITFFDTTINGGSRLIPHFTITAGKTIKSKKYYYTYVPAIHIKSTLLFPPSIDATFMMFVKDNLGYGLSYRYGESLVLLLQFKVMKILRFSFSVDLITNGIKNQGATTRELMMNYSCSGSGGFGESRKACPAYEL